MEPKGLKGDRVRMLFQVISGLMKCANSHPIWTRHLKVVQRVRGRPLIILGRHDAKYKKKLYQRCVEKIKQSEARRKQFFVEPLHGFQSPF